MLHGLWPIPLVLFILAAWFAYQTARTDKQIVQIKVPDTTDSAGYRWADSEEKANKWTTPTTWYAVICAALGILAIYGFTHWWA